MERELVNLLKVLVLDKFGYFLVLIAGTSCVWVLSVWALNAASRWSERYRLLFQSFIPWVKAMLVVSALWVMLIDIIKLPEDRLIYLLAVAIVAVGLSSKDLLSSIVAYFSIVWNKPFQIGDRVQVGDVYGQIVDIGLSCTKLRTPGDSVATIPNSTIISTVTVNTNYASLHSMADIDFYLSHREDPQVVKKILWQAAVTSKFFYPEQRVQVLVSDQAFCTRYRVKAYTYDTRAEFRFMSDVTETAKREFLRRGMTYAAVPFIGGNEK